MEVDVRVMCSSSSQEEVLVVLLIVRLIRNKDKRFQKGIRIMI
jgi:hypothetical protein